MNTQKSLVFLTVNSSYSHSGMVMALLHQACSAVPGWRWQKLEVTREEDSFSIAGHTTLFPCDLLCATLYLFNREKTLDILRRVKALYSQVHIAVGGPECSSREAASALLQECPFISSVFSGEGEGLFPDFLRNFSNYKSTCQIFPENGERAVWDSWENSSLPVEDEFFACDKPFVQIETSRGCPMGCTYCTSCGVRTRYRSLDQVKTLLDGLQAKGVTEIRVLDRTFNLPEKRGEALLRLFYQYPSMRFHLEIHPQFLGESLKQCLREAPAGLLHIEAGMQSLSESVQEAIGRKSSVKTALEGLRFLCSCTAFETHVDLLAGLPGQTWESLQLDVELLTQCAPAEIQLENLKILPGTPILGHTEQYKIVYNSRPPYEVMRTGTLSTGELLDAQKLSRTIDLFYNHEALHNVLLCAAGERARVLLELFEYIRRKGVSFEGLMNLKKRFLFLHDFLQEYQLSSSLEEWRYRWLLNGYPPTDELLKEFIFYKDSVNEDLRLVFGEKESLFHRESKYYSLFRQGREWILVYNRKYRFNGPCAGGFCTLCRKN